jgi:type IX secretion system PorP/SprF family membrane protein
MLKRILKFASLACIALICKTANSQVDPHFSQYYIYPQWLNPALTGVMDGDYRVAGIYRSQWANIDNGFSTIGAALEIATSKNINFGVGVFKQTAGTGGYQYTTPSGSISYNGIKFGRTGTHHISLGIQAGFIDKRFDPSKFKFGDQYNQIQTADIIATPQQTYFDLGAGVLYYDATPNKKLNGFVGLSFGHITEPTDRFLATSSGEVAKLPMRQMLHGGVRINVSPTFSITPNYLLMKQGTAHERMLGAYAQLKAGEGFDFLCGANYRFDDAIVPFIGAYYKDFVVGLSYDVTTSQLAKVAGSTQGFELSVSYTGKKRRNLSEQPFVCPRL